MKSFFLVLVLSFNVFALDSVKMDEGRYIAVENNLLDKNEITFILLPGIFRALDYRDAVIGQAKKNKLNFISMHFSLHPESLLMIPKNETPYAKLHKYGAQDLADEVRAVIGVYKIKKPVIVGLSYSSAVTTELAQSAKFPLIIETAPMIQYDESDPAGSSITSFWKNYFGLNPIFGGVWTDLYLQQVYEHYWSKEVDSMLKNNPEYRKSNLRSLMVSSYAKLSIAVDGFDFLKQTFVAQNGNYTKRMFLLADQEEENRFTLQQKAVELYEQQTGETKSVIIIKNAGHIIPSDAPRAYLRALKKIATGL